MTDLQKALALYFQAVDQARAGGQRVRDAFLSIVMAHVARELASGLDDEDRPQ